VAKRPAFPNYHGQPAEGVPAAGGAATGRKK
jgi:hypothetical protein